MSTIIPSSPYTNPIFDEKCLDKDNIHFKQLSGYEGTPFIADIGQLIIDVYKEWPYLYEGTTEEQTQYIQKRYIEKPNSMIITAFEHKKLVGLGMGVPLSEAPDHYLAPFRCDNRCLEFPLEDVFYVGELIVKPEYRQQRIAKEICQMMGNHILNSHRYQAVAFCTVNRPSDFHLAHLKPENYFSPDSFWEELGFTKYENLTFTGVWRLVQESDESQHQMIYWVKKL
jgi:hypothetical protein